MSERQLNEFKAYFSDNKDFASGKGNNRLPQPLNDRKLYYSDWISKSKSSASSLLAVGATMVTLIATTF